MECAVTKNVAVIDRVLRVMIGLALIAFALGLIFPATGWNWIGWIGVVPILTAVVGYCPAYGLLGISTSPREAH
jgi:sulfite exporter TauE/SafE